MFPRFIHLAPRMGLPDICVLAMSVSVPGPELDVAYIGEIAQRGDDIPPISARKDL
jgi:hypothetical protein